MQAGGEEGDRLGRGGEGVAELVVELGEEEGEEERRERGEGRGQAGDLGERTRKARVSGWGGGWR